MSPDPADVPIERPLFVIGCGRSGTTIFFRMLAEHPELAWISNYSNRFGDSAPLLWSARLRHAPGIRALGDHPLRPRPVEGYRPWVDCFPGFARPVRDLCGRDAHADCVQRLQALVRRHLAVQRRTRFAAKYTGWSRIAFMDRAFPDARYLHVVRDGRAVAASLLRVGFWEGWRGPAQWRWGPLDAADATLWERSGASFAVLAGLQWKLLVRNIRAAGEALGERYREVRYEEFVADRFAVLPEVLEWAGLAGDERFRRRVAAFALRSADEKWRETLPEQEQQLLQEAIGADLQEFGYTG